MTAYSLPKNAKPTSDTADTQHAELENALAVWEFGNSQWST